MSINLSHARATCPDCGHTVNQIDASRAHTTRTAKDELIEAGARVVDDAESRPSDYENVDVVAAAVLDAFLAHPRLADALREAGVVEQVGPSSLCTKCGWAGAPRPICPRCPYATVHIPAPNPPLYRFRGAAAVSARKGHT